MRSKFLLVLSVVCLLSACYSSPEMTGAESPYRKGSAVCAVFGDDAYQHAELKHCMEQKMAYEDAHRKTVEIVHEEEKNIVIPYPTKELEETATVEEVEEVYQEQPNDATEDTFVEETTTTTTSVDNDAELGNAQGVTLVVGPLKEDLTISVKTTDRVQTQQQVKKVETKKTTKTKVVKQDEKEVLPVEEK